jgi:hypothetical protein
MIKYYKEQKTGEEKVLRVDLDSLKAHPGNGEIKVYDVIFIKQASAIRKSDEAMLKVPIVAPGLIPEDSLKPDNKYGFTLNEITYEEFKLYVNKTIDQLGEILASDEHLTETKEVKLTATVTSNGKSHDIITDSQTN